MDKAIRDELNQPQLFSSKPVLMRAFQAAKGSGKAKSELSDDYVELGEFRLLLVYLRQYFELDVAYNRLDSSDDRRLSLPEFRAGVEMLKQWGVNVAPDQVEAEFKLIDTNGGGIVLFDEFADWAIKKELDLEDDDDFDDGTEIRFVSAAEGAGHARTGRSTGRPQSSRGRSTSSSRSPKPGGGRPSSAFGSARPGTAGSRGSGMVSPKRLPRRRRPSYSLMGRRRLAAASRRHPTSWPRRRSVASGRRHAASRSRRRLPASRSRRAAPTRASRTTVP